MNRQAPKHRLWNSGIALAWFFLATGCSDTRAPFCEVGTPCEGASAEGCEDGLEARLYGRAGFDGKTCVPEARACSRATLTCQTFGQCAAPPPARPHDECAGDDADFRGANVVKCVGRGTCIAADDASCQASAYCTLEGRCVATDGLCVADTDDNCRNSNYCNSIGWCAVVTTADGPRCRATSTVDCRASAACAKGGDCAVGASWNCADCIRSIECASDGLCDLDGDRCIALAAQSCTRSEACRQNGRCRAFQGACIKGL